MKDKTDNCENLNAKHVEELRIIVKMVKNILPELSSVEVKINHLRLLDLLPDYDTQKYIVSEKVTINAIRATDIVLSVKLFNKEEFKVDIEHLDIECSKGLSALICNELASQLRKFLEKF